MTTRLNHRVAAAAIALVVLAGCGGSGGSAQDKRFVGRVNDLCYANLSRVYQAVDATKTNAPRDDVIAQAQQRLSRVADRLDGLPAPSGKRDAVTAVTAEMRSSAQAMARYLSDKQSNEPATSNDWNRMLAQLSQLEQIASGDGMRACSLPQQT